MRQRFPGPWRLGGRCERFSMCARLLAKKRYVKKKREREKETENDTICLGKRGSPVLELTLRLAHVSLERKSRG